MAPNVAGMAKLVGGGRLDSSRRRLEEDSLGLQGPLRLTCGVEQLQLPSWARVQLPGVLYAWTTAEPSTFSSPPRTSRNGGSSCCGRCPPSERTDGLPADFIGIIHETVGNPKKLLNATAAVGFRNSTVFYLTRLITKLGMSFARCTYPKKEQVMLRALFFHVIDGATDELFTDACHERKSGSRHGG